MLIEPVRPSATPEMVDELAVRLRLPSGFADAPTDAARLTRLLNVAARLVEARTRQALIRRMIQLRKSAWDGGDRLTLPVGPVVSVEALALERPEADRVTVDPSVWRLDALGAAPAIVARQGRRLPSIPSDGFVEARFTAGHGDAWSDSPDDLRHAVIELAAAYFDGLPETAPAPAGVAALLERHRPVRL